MLTREEIEIKLAGASNDRFEPTVFAVNRIAQVFGSEQSLVTAFCEYIASDTSSLSGRVYKNQIDQVLSDLRGIDGTSDTPHPLETIVDQLINECFAGEAESGPSVRRYLAGLCKATYLAHDQNMKNDYIHSFSRMEIRINAGIKGVGDDLYDAEKRLIARGLICYDRDRCKLNIWIGHFMSAVWLRELYRISEHE
ncbi:MAG: hypothetical protein NT169_21390 [Chloroflexi bacterium]|nr:hypothetical protein [Chloroflexota bacterium]